MARTTLWRLVASLGVLALTFGARAQDRGDAGSQGAMRAYRPSVPGTRAVVTSAHPLASMAGAQILMAGGNAADAAVAIAATITIVEPQSSSLAGNGFTTYYDKKSGKVLSLSMAGAAPHRIRAEEMTEATLNSGIKSAVVPGHLGGLIALLQRFGTRTLAEVLQPALRYAEEGHPVHSGLASGIAGRKALFGQFESSAAVFLPSGRAPEAGELFRMPDYAALLRKLIDAEQQAVRGGATRENALQAAFDRFYTGDIARDFTGFFEAQGGVLTMEDLGAYKPEWTDPVHTTYRGYDVYSNPATSRGGLEMMMQLNVLEGFDLKALGPRSAQTLHLAIEAIKLAKTDVYKYVGDPKFTSAPTVGLMSKAYAAERRKLIHPEHAMQYPPAGNPSMFQRSTAAFQHAAPPRSGRQFTERYEADLETTSFSIVDPAGNAVASTPTIGGGFGTSVVVGRSGLLFNNGMRLGSTSPYPDSVNYVRGGQIPLLNNSPVIVMKDGKLVLAIGTPGGEGIGQTQLQTLLNILDFGMPIQEAIEAPRFVLAAEPNFYKAGAAVTVEIERRVPADALAQLEAMGHTIRLLPEFTATVGGMQGILVDLKKGTMAGGADPRRAGYAIGW